MSKSKIIQGKFVNKYKVPLDQIDDFNIKYDNLKKSLPSHGPNLAGAIKTEFGITNFFQTMDLYDTLVTNIQDFIKLIYDPTLYNSTNHYNIDTEKLPLGSLSISQINKAFDILKGIS